jgi:glycosyltransferase involved in cell wall biosynthesis
MKIAMIGAKGVPATHGGVERHVEELGARLVGLGHEVTVFTRPNYADPSLVEYRGMRLVSLPTVGTKHLDAIVHSTIASFVAAYDDFDIVHYHAIGPCLASPITKVAGRKIVATIHGQDWRRAKWGPFATNVLRTAEWTTLRVPDAVICVSETLARQYQRAGHAKVAYVPNGVTIDPGDDPDVLDELGVAKGEYLLFAGRLVPEKGLHYLVEAHSTARHSMPLVVAGDSSNSDEYVSSIRRKAGSGLVLAGYQYGAKLAALFRHCALFVLPSDLEGLPIVLLEALAYGAPVLASDIAPNIEILGGGGHHFRAGDVQSLAREMDRALVDPAALVAHASAEQRRITADYDWDEIAQSTVGLYLSVAKKPK